jgi:hypothetical protein
MSKTILALLIFLWPTAHAAEVTRSTSAFESADLGSKQVSQLHRGQKTKVTGPAVEAEGQRWYPILVNGKAGYVQAGSLKLDSTDASDSASSAPSEEYRQEDHRLSHVHFWGGIGPAAMLTSSTTQGTASYGGNQYVGVGAGFGAEWYLGQERRTVIGTQFLYPIENENSPGYAGGIVRRFSFLGSFGYSLVPQKLDLLGQIGPTYVDGSNANFEAKLGFTIGLGLVWNLSDPKANSLYQGISFTAYRVEETTKAIADSASLGLTSGICEGLSSALNVSNVSCGSGVAPAAYVFALLYRIGWQN